MKPATHKGSTGYPQVKVSNSRQENAAVIKYQGSWGSEANNTFFGGAARTSALAGSRATVSAANSTQLAIVAQKGPNRGIVNISIDGGPAVAVDLYSAVRTRSMIVFVTDLLPRATHTASISPRAARNRASTANTINIDSVIFR